MMVGCFKPQCTIPSHHNTSTPQLPDTDSPTPQRSHIRTPTNRNYCTWQLPHKSLHTTSRLPHTVTPPPCDSHTKQLPIPQHPHAANPPHRNSPHQNRHTPKLPHTATSPHCNPPILATPPCGNTPTLQRNYTAMHSHFNAPKPLTRSVILNLQMSKMCLFFIVCIRTPQLPHSATPTHQISHTLQLIHTATPYTATTAHLNSPTPQLPHTEPSHTGNSSMRQMGHHQR